MPLTKHRSNNDPESDADDAVSMRRHAALRVLMCSAASALVMQPPLRCTACTTTIRALHMLEGESLADEEEWSPLDQWLQKGGAERKAGSTLEARAPVTVESAGHIHSHFFGRGSFEQLGVSEPLCASLAACGYTQPSTAQVASFKVQAKGEDLVLAQPSGSGKTLAYLVPLLQRIAEAEAESGKTPPGARPPILGHGRGHAHPRGALCTQEPTPAKPPTDVPRVAWPGAVRAIILVPTTDLAQQVLFYEPTAPSLQPLTQPLKTPQSRP